jgi:hypothetical protein
VTADPKAGTKTTGTAIRSASSAKLRKFCIVEAPPRGSKQEVFLPFEGDSKLSVILSKAFLLAADDKIKDPTILNQIRRR